VASSGDSGQLALGVKTPWASVAEKLTVPGGGFSVPLSVSPTVAVHVVDVVAGGEEGVQLTLVEVVRAVTVSVCWPLLEWFVESPP
jgi:hypothetical protein